MRKVQIILGVLLGIIVNYYYNFFFHSKINIVMINGCRTFSASYLQQMVKGEIADGITNLQKIKQLILEEDFISNCNVKQLYPDILLIDIIEKEPLAKNIDNSIVTMDNSIIKTNPSFKIDLIKISGKSYQDELQELIDKLKLFNIKPELCIFIRPGRWNLIYQGKVIKLPEYNIEQGLLSVIKNRNESWFEFAKEIDLRKLGYAIVTQTTGDHTQWLSEIV